MAYVHTQVLFVDSIEILSLKHNLHSIHLLQVTKLSLLQP